MENYYFQSFKENTQYGDIKVKQGIIKSFPNTLQIEDTFLFSQSEEAFKTYLIIKKNLKILRQNQCCPKMIQILASSKKTVIIYQHFLNTVLICNKKKQSHKYSCMKVQAKPQVIRLNKIYYIFWFKNLAQLQIMNMETMVIEQNIFLQRKENWLQVIKVHRKSEFIFELCLRNNKSISFYDIDLLTSPLQLLLTSKIELQQQNKLTHLTIVNQNHICNIQNDYMSEKYLSLQIIDRTSKDNSSKIVEFMADEKVQLLNQKQARKGDQPIIIKLSQNQLGILTNIEKQKFDFSIFRRLNAINQILSHNRNCAIYTQEIRHQVLIYIIRKLDDGRANIWYVKIPKNVIENISKQIANPL
ncbi:UNKNOWN [Stylonychia lemnae]|uniref:Uncharacterized protein n=1 Tax=Stylonychia lemnae TaxID=5949 RepID=A0A078AQM1_STYLE|nr:UNKNOWN [Stylonychia lemnae]|eukprot:CDW84484.1 UNKNOWN [Stylonychia lemnae]